MTEAEYVAAIKQCEKDLLSAFTNNNTYKHFVTSYTQGASKTTTTRAPLINSIKLVVKNEHARLATHRFDTDTQQFVISADRMFIDYCYGICQAHDQAIWSLAMTAESIIPYFAYKFTCADVDKEDIRQEAYIGLYIAAARFEIGHCNFATYANYWVRANIIRKMETYANIIKLTGPLETLQRKINKVKTLLHHSNKDVNIANVKALLLEIYGVEYDDNAIHSVIYRPKREYIPSLQETEETTLALLTDDATPLTILTAEDKKRYEDYLVVVNQIFTPKIRKQITEFLLCERDGNEVTKISLAKEQGLTYPSYSNLMKKYTLLLRSIVWT